MILKVWYLNTRPHSHGSYWRESLSSAYPINCCYNCLYSSRRSVCLYSKLVAELVFSILTSLKYESYCGTSKDSCMWTYWGASTELVLVFIEESPLAWNKTKTMHGFGLYWENISQFLLLTAFEFNSLVSHFNCNIFSLIMATLN